jgi:diadenosine tetraphosphate (Ap4A) HIT family hydrolase
MENELVFALYDINPITLGHMLIVPKRHYLTIFESTPDEVNAIFELTQKARALLVQEYKPDGFNITANCGKSAGQIVMHAHLHLLPRYEGQLFNPKTLYH